MSLKDGNLIVKEYHTCVKEKQSVVLDTQRMSDQVWTIAVAEPTTPAIQIATEVIEAVIEEYEGMLEYIIWTFWMTTIFSFWVDDGESIRCFELLEPRKEFPIFI